MNFASIDGEDTVSEIPSAAPLRGPTIYDVAKIAGVSAKTVSNVLNDYHYVKETTRSRVQDAMREVGYRPNSTARNLRGGRTGIISLTVPELSLPYYANLTQNVIRAAEERTWSVLIEQTYGDPEREAGVLFGPLRQQTDGVIIAGPTLDADAPAFARVTYPIIALADAGRLHLVDTLSVDNRAASRAATEHLIETGRSRIALVGAYPTSRQAYRQARIDGHLEALSSAGLPQDPLLTVACEVWDREAGYDSTRALIRTGVAFDGIRYLNDALALGGLRALRDHAVAVPHQVAVIGFDDLEESRSSVPSLSSVSAGRTEIATLAVDSLAEQARSMPDRRRRDTTVPWRVTPRESTIGLRAGT